jgi:DNA-binding XRE family transcriptional regulator
VNYGIPNKEHQPTIAPGSPVPLAERNRPAWLCITAPEYSHRGIPDKETLDLTPEQIAEAEAEEARAEALRAAKRKGKLEERERLSAARRLEDVARREKISRERQLARRTKDTGQAKAISESLKTYRMTHDLNQLGLAKLLGCTSQSIGKWEHGKSFPRPQMLKKISAIIS